MARVRLGVAMLVEGRIGHEIDGLRRALGDRSRGNIAPHVTLVPPVNVHPELLPDVLRVLRAAAAQERAFRMGIGPAASFLPHNPCVYLAVGDDADAPGAAATLARLADRCAEAPLARPRQRAFVPHVTISIDHDADAIPATLATLAGYRAVVDVDRIHLLQMHGQGAERRWVPIADVPLGPARVVGRGGLPVELTAGALIDPEVRAALDPPPPVVVEQARALVVAARRDGRAVGAASGRTWADGSAEIDWLGVLGGFAHEGIEQHLRAAFAAVAAERAANGPGGGPAGDDVR